MERIRVVQRERGLLPPLCIAFVERFTVGFFTTGFPLMATSVHGLGRPQIGMLLAAFLYPFALLSWPFGRLAESWSRRHMVAIGCAVYGALVMLVGMASPTQSWVLMPLLGVSSAVLFVPSLLWLLEAAPQVPRTTAIASFHAAGSLGFLLGPLCCGQLIALGGGGASGYRLAFAVAGLAALLGALLAIRGKPR
jgi:MFS family permease